MVKQMRKQETRVITGNACSAHAVRLCRPDVVALYPITPQSEVVEQLTRFKADGQLAAEMIEVEGENSAMNSVTAACIAGGRAYTASSSYGLVFMYDAMLIAASYRAPIVMTNVNRETPGILAVSCGQQDMISVRDTGWIQLIVEDCQEIVDVTIQAFRLAEDYDIQLPVMINYDGYYVSYSAEAVKLPLMADVDEYLSILKKQPERMKLTPGKALGVGTHGILLPYTEMRYKHLAALERSKTKFDQIDREYGDFFGRYYGGQIEEYRCDDAEIVLVTSGSAAGTARTVIDRQREMGLKAGLIKLRMFRPFPQEKMARALKGKKAIGVLDRSIDFGWNCGPIYTEIKSLAAEIGPRPMLSFIDGLANMDITIPNIERMLKDIQAAAEDKPYQKVTWISLEQ
jgi:pyruvate/2-oxoacid:ferredoxin oxidoreductase alpha subunit